MVTPCSEVAESGVDGVKDSGSRCRVLELLVPHHIPELVLQKTLDPVDEELSTRAEDVQGSRQEQVLVLM